MQKKFKNEILSEILCITLIVAMAFCTVGCNGKAKEEEPAGTEAVTFAEGDVIGEGVNEFAFTVVDGEGVETTLEIHTDETNVGAALLQLGVISGEEGEYGLFVKTVNGITVDFDEDGKYWAFYINGEYAQTGVDSTDIIEGDSYAFKVE